jgi:hypothetical protein
MPARIKNVTTASVCCKSPVISCADFPGLQLPSRAHTKIHTIHRLLYPIPYPNHTTPNHPPPHPLPNHTPTPTPTTPPAPHPPLWQSSLPLRAKSQEHKQKSSPDLTSPHSPPWQSPQPLHPQKLPKCTKDVQQTPPLPTHLCGKVYSLCAVEAQVEPPVVGSCIQDDELPGLLFSLRNARNMREMLQRLPLSLPC